MHVVQMGNNCSKTSTKFHSLQTQKQQQNEFMSPVPVGQFVENLVN